MQQSRARNLVEERAVVADDLEQSAQKRSIQGAVFCIVDRAFQPMDQREAPRGKLRTILHQPECLSLDTGDRFHQLAKLAPEVIMLFRCQGFMDFRPDRSGHPALEHVVSLNDLLGEIGHDDGGKQRGNGGQKRLHGQFTAH